MIRKMGNFNVTQRTKDGRFNATELLKNWNISNPDKRKDLDNFWKGVRLNEFMQEVAENEYNSKHVEFTDLKKLLSNVHRGKNGGTWMDKYLFMKFAMWLNPTFEYQVIKFVYDEMIKYRNDAGNAYVQLGKSVGKLVNKDFMPRAMQKIGEALNHVVFGKHEKGIRNQFGNEENQKELYELEKKLSELINEGFIKSYDELVNYLRKQYHKKNNPKVFAIE